MSEVLFNLADQAATRNGVPTNIFRSLIDRETGGTWDNSLRGKAGEIGLAQVKPATGAGVGVVDLENPAMNLEAGARYLKLNFDKFGNWRDALRGYNAGTKGATDNPNISAEYADAILGKASTGDSFTDTAKKLFNGTPLGKMINLNKLSIQAGTAIGTDTKLKVNPDGSISNDPTVVTNRLQKFLSTYLPIIALLVLATLLVVAGGWQVVTQSAQGAKKFAGA